MFLRQNSVFFVHFFLSHGVVLNILHVTRCCSDYAGRCTRFLVWAAGLERRLGHALYRPPFPASTTLVQY